MADAPVTLEGWYTLHEMWAVDWGRWNALAGGGARRDRRRGARRARDAGRARRRPQRLLLPADPEGRPLPACTGGATSRRCGAARSPSRARGCARTCVPTYSYLAVIELGTYELTGHATAMLKRRGLEPGARRVRRRARGGDAEDGAAAALSRGSAAALLLLLPDVEAARRAGELVRPAGERARGVHARPRRDRPQVRRQGGAGHPGLGRPRRLGVGRHALRRRSARLQEAHLRDALRRRELALRALRPVLRRHPLRALRRLGEALGEG